MIHNPPFVKIFDGVATREQMFELLNRVPDAPAEDIASGNAWTNQWFEIREHEYETMLDCLPPLFMRSGLFAMSELKAGCVASVYFEINHEGHDRWFHGFCNLQDRQSPDAMRAAIIAHESDVAARLMRTQQLDRIWSSTHPDYRGLAGEINPDAWPAEHRGKRTILVYEPGVGTVLKLLENLTDDEIADRLPERPTIQPARVRAASPPPGTLS